MRQTKTLPRPRFVGLYPGSLQVAASPCWELALPDVSSTVCVEALGPIPRRVRPVHLPVSSQTTSASPHEGQVRHAKYPLHYNFSEGSSFRGCSHSLMFRLLNLLDLPVVPTAGICQGGQAFYTRQDLRRYRTQVVASLRTRLGQLVRRDFHPLDCILVGCYPPRKNSVVDETRIAFASDTHPPSRRLWHSKDPTRCGLGNGHDETQRRVLWSVLVVEVLTPGPGR